MHDNSNNYSEHAQHILDVLEQAARKAGAHILELQQHNASLQVHTHKDDGSYSIHADVACEQILLTELQQHMPLPYSVLSEESGAQQSGHQLIIVVDPIDGTFNYSRGFADFAISLGIAIDGVPIGGVVYMPAFNVLYRCFQGKGAYCNGALLEFAAQYPKKLVAVGGMSKHLPTQFIDTLNGLDGFGWKKIYSDVSSLCWTAEGKFDGCVLLHTYPWDMCAGIALLQEAGAVVLDTDGNEPTLQSHSIVAGTKETVQGLLNIMRQFKK